MNLFKKFRSALSRCLEPKRNKNGSSLAFVMVVGAVLVIWVLCIMPLMTAVGTNGIAMSGSYSDYLQSRSAIEFCKSELEKIVETDPPKTFAVIKNSEGYAVVYKRSHGNNVDTTQLTSYGNLINYSGDDKTDTPKDNSVVAICAVVKDPDKSEYNITITTYNDGKPGLTYSTVYTIRGTLKINPESYLKSQALPLSDFVIVDGKLGATTLWNSTIHDSGKTFEEGKSNSVTNLSDIQEHLLPYSENADAGPFPSVFKTTVFPAASTAPTEPNYTGNAWTIPNPVDKNKNNKKNGDIWFEKQNNNKIKVYIRTSTNSKQELGSSDYKLYVNGTYLAKDTAASNTNIYQISVDYYGSSSNKILQANGLVLGYIGSPISSNVNKHTAPVKTNISINGTTVTIEKNNSNNGVIYGYCAVENFPNVQWNQSANQNTFEVKSDKAYYFFAYRPESYQNGTYYAASDVTYMGCVYPMQTTSTLDSGSDYLIVVKRYGNNSYYNAMGQDNGNITHNGEFSFPVLVANSSNYSDNYLWHVEGSNSTYTFQNKGNSKYLSLTGSAKREQSWFGYGEYKWTYNLILADNTNNASFTYNSKKLSRSLTSNGQTKTGYVYFQNGFKGSQNGSEIYFVKVDGPADPDMTQLEIVSSFVTLQANTITYGTPITSVISGTYSANDLRANGSKINGNLNVGKYNITLNSSNSTRNLGMIEVTKAPLTGNLTVEATNNDHNVTIEIKAKNVVDGGKRWIGYKTAGSNEDFKWFPADNNDSYTFALPYGSYEFVARESGNNNYNPAQSSPLPVELKAPELEDTSTPSLMMGSSLYFMGRNGSIDTKDATIYLHTDLIVLRHDIVGTGSVIINPYSQDLNTYDPNDTAPDTLLFAVNDIKNASGKVVFKALTFYRIPAGTDINEITDAEAVNLHPLNINNDIDKLKLLLRSEDYPEINMDIAYIDRENNEDKSTDNQLAHIVSGETIGWTVDGVLADTTAKLSTTSKNNSKYVVCAYVSSVKNDDIDLMANRVLLAAAETEVNGITTRKLSVPNSLTFECRYFSVYADIVQQGSSRAELVIENLIRDQSDWDRIFDILNLTDYSSKSLQIDFELSTSVVHYDNTFDAPITAQIYRIDEERWNIFTPFDPKPLTVTYTNDELYNLIWDGIDWDNLSWSDLGKILSTLTNISMRVVDRYVSIIPEGRPNLELTAYKNCKIEFYTNYLYIHPDIEGYSFKEFSFFGSKGTADMLINSQERGYESEYLGFFTTNSVETYHGTIICIARDNEKLPYGYYRDANGALKTNGGITVNGNFIPSGFYFIPATSEANGTSITELGKLETDPEKEEYYQQPSGVNAKRIDPAELPKYSIYIKQDGTLSDAYVDTGLIGNGDLGESGFSGGNVG